MQGAITLSAHLPHWSGRKLSMPIYLIIVALFLESLSLVIYWLSAISLTTCLPASPTFSFLQRYPAHADGIPANRRRRKPSHYRKEHDFFITGF